VNLDRKHRRIRDEVAHHISELEAQLEAEGMSREQAVAEAARRFGDRNRIEQATREIASGWGMWTRRADIVRQDVAHALRQMLRHPLVSGLTLATLVVGVSATTIVFSVVHAVVLSPLPFHESERLLHVSQTSPQGRPYSISEPNFVDFRARQRSFVEMAAMGFDNPILSGLGDAESVEGMRVSHTFFSLLGITPILGRDFLAEEDLFGGATDVVLLSEGAWQRRYGSDEDVVGSTMFLDGSARRIVGVVPSGRAWPGVEVFAPLAPNPDVFRDDQRLEAIGRLLPGVTIEQAARDMSEIALQLSDEYPESTDRWGAAVQRARDWLIGPQLTQLGGFLLGPVGLFLLMACASVSNLLLARATVRLQEMGVRAALGAGRGRLAAQLTVEGLVLAVLGGALSVVLTLQGLRIVQALGPADIARLGEAGVNTSVLLVATAAAALAVVAAGAAPALLMVRGSVFSGLRMGSGAASGTGRRFRDGLVVAQFALAVTVVLSATLLTRSFVRLQNVELGFEPSGLLRFAVRLPDDRFSQATREDFLRLLREDVEAIPGVEAMGATSAPPFSRFGPSNFVARSDQEPDRQEDFVPVSWRAISGDYFAAAGIPLLAGRLFGPEDRPAPRDQVLNPPVIIDRALADMLWPGQDPLGRLVTWFLPGGRQCEVIGVVASARDEQVEGMPRPRIYRPFSYTFWDQPSVLVRTAGEATDLIPTLRRAVLSLDAAVPAISPAPVEQDLRETIAWPRFTMQVLTVFGFIALALAAMGIYGVTAFSVAQRRREIGVRVALGAEPAGVHWMVMRGAMRLALPGIVVGVAVSLGLMRFLETLLFDISSVDPVTYLLVPSTLALVAVASAWLPAKRAVRLDPRSALVSE